MRLEKFRHLREYFEVFRDLFRDIGPLHLDYHFAAITQRSRVNLPERGSGHGRLIETRERL